MTRTLTGLVGAINARLDLALSNLWNSNAITDNAAPSILGPNLVNVLARRNFVVSAVADL